MAKSATWSVAIRNAKLDAIAPEFDDGYLRYYTGTQPAGPGTAIGSQVLLAELRFDNPAFGAASAGVLTANAITGDADAAATGTATWYRCLASDGTTALHDGSIGTSNANLILASTNIVSGEAVDCSAFTITDAATSIL